MMCTKHWYDVKKLLFLLLVAIDSCFQVFAQNTDSIHYSYQKTDSSYTFYGRIKLVANTACVMHICFNYNHIKALAVDASKVELIDEAENWNDISFSYRKFPFYTNESLWHRTLNTESQRVDFVLISSENSHSYMPQMLSSSGYYKLSQHNGVLTVEYFQQCSLTHSFLTAFYHNFIKKKAVEFLYTLKTYAEKHCSSMD